MRVGPASPPLGGMLPAGLLAPAGVGALAAVVAPLELRERIVSAMASATGAASAVASGSTAVGRTGSATVDPDHAHGAGGGDSVPTAAAAAALTMDELVRNHADAVYRVALSITKDIALAEDASQNALIKAWQALPSYRAEAPLRHWILRIAHNESVSLLRRRREQTVSPFDMVERPSMVRSVEVQVEDRVAIERFEAALGDLDVTSRSIVILREVEGLAYNEICDVLDLPLPTVRTRLLRARRTLATALDGWQP